MGLPLSLTNKRSLKIVFFVLYKFLSIKHFNSLSESPPFSIELSCLFTLFLQLSTLSSLIFASLSDIKELESDKSIRISFFLIFSLFFDDDGIGDDDDAEEEDDDDGERG